MAPLETKLIFHGPIFHFHDGIKGNSSIKAVMWAKYGWVTLAQVYKSDSFPPPKVMLPPNKKS